MLFCHERMLKSVFFFMKMQIIVSMICNVFKHEFNPESIMTEELVEDILTDDEPSDTIDYDNVNLNSNSKNYDFDSARKTDINDRKMTNHNWCSISFFKF